MLDDHRGLALHTTRVIAVLAAVLTVSLLAARRPDGLAGLYAGTAVGLADVLLLSRSLTRFAGAGGELNPRALGVGMFTRFLSVAVLLGLVLCIRALNPLAAIVGFLLMPSAVTITGVWHTRRLRIRGAADAVR